MLAILADLFWAIVPATIVGLLLAVPLYFIARSQRKLTWTGAIGVGTLISSVMLILIAEVPSKVLYLFSAKYRDWTREAPIVKRLVEGTILGGTDTYIITADIVANTIQGIFFVIIVALAYFWGEKQRKAGRFKS